MTISTATAKRLRHRLITIARNSSGATAIEYALIAGGIGIAIVVSVNGLGSTLDGLYQSFANAF